MMGAFLKMKLTCLFVVLCSAGFTEAEISDCFGMKCWNGGLLETNDKTCYCRCPAQFSGIYCEYELQHSLWPPGPYAIPTPIDGCPETASQGWGSGYINFTTTVPLAIQVSQENDIELYLNTNNTSSFVDITLASQHKALALGPFGKYTFQLNFCFKSVDHTMHLMEQWPFGNYMIYRGDKACPLGFEDSVSSLFLPQLLNWNSDGYLPETKIELTQNGEAIVHLMMCSRVSNSTFDDATPVWNTPFIFLKKESENCTEFDGFKVTQETIKISPRTSISEGLDDTTGFSYCYFMPLNMQYGQVTHISEMEFTDVVLQNFSTRTIYDVKTSFARMYKDVFKNINLAECEPSYLKFQDGVIPVERFQAYDEVPWILLDLGSRAKVKRIIVLLEMAQALFSGANEDFPDLMITDNKWSFLNHGAEICRFNTQTELPLRMFHTLLRQKDGRYVALVGTKYKANVNIVDYILRLQCVNIITQELHVGTDKVCHRELGMTDGVIEDFQITASSWSPGYSPNMARQFHLGWCADGADTNPFLQIDLISPTTVEGLTIFNWHDIVEDTHQNKFEQGLVPMGCRSFHLSYGTHLNELRQYSAKEFNVDLSRPYSEPQTTMFMKPFLARYVRIFAEALVDITCLKVELFGCRKSVIPELQQCVDVGASQLVNVSEAFISAVDHEVIVNGFRTWHDCMEECMQRRYQCSTVEYRPGEQLCTMFMSSYTHNYQQIFSNNASVVLSTKMCWKDAVDHTPQLQIITGTSKLIDTIIINKTNEEGVITSYGYPFHYETKQSYTWYIKFDVPKIYDDDYGFIRLIFSNISLNVYEIMNRKDCIDTIKINVTRFEELVPYVDDGMEREEGIFSINYRYNGLTPTFATGWSEVYLTLQTCVGSSKMLLQGKGFRAIIKKDDIANCFSLSYRRNLLCQRPEMRLASDAFYGLPQLYGKDKYWKIQVDAFIPIRLRIYEFDVNCDDGLLFITDPVGKNGIVSEFCNSRRPYGEIQSTYGRLELHLKRFQINTRVLGFRAYYKTFSKNATVANLKSIDKVHTEELPDGQVRDMLTVCSKKLLKCYDVIPTSPKPRSSIQLNWIMASNMCFEMNKRLVVIHSRIEMQFIRQALEQFVFAQYKQDYLGWDAFYSFRFNPYPLFYAYIGLRRYVDHDGKQHELWDDGSPLTFTAWGNQQPKGVLINQCTSMSFDRMDNENTWVTESCTRFQTASFFICEQGWTNGIPDIPETILNGRTFTSSIPDEPSVLYHCKSGEWIHVLAVCDGVPDCDDRSDEMYCTYSKTNDGDCKGNMFTCANGRCVHLSDVCNYIDDCYDGSDEYCEFPRCVDGEFKCSNKQCIPKYSLCDAYKDCLDGSDEINCETCNKTSAFLCSDRTCIPASSVCDGYQDCVGNMDEKLCVKDNMYTCIHWWEAGYRSNGLYKIDDAEDIDNVLEVECQFKKHNGLLEVLTIMLDSENANRIRLNQECAQEYVQTCDPDLLAVAKYDGIHFGRSYSQCACIRTVFDYNRSEIMFRYCANISRVPADPSTVSLLQNSLVDVNYTIELPVTPNQTRFIIYPEVCRKEIVIDEHHRTLVCEAEHRVIPEDKRCLYDLSKTGVIDGCLSLEHLQNCEKYECPAGFVKCPESFCLATRFVCDGLRHCKGGEDELDCLCKLVKKELVIIYRKTFDEEIRSNVYKLAQQFYSNRSIVHVVNMEQMAISNSTPLLILRTEGRLFSVTDELIDSSEQHLDRYRSTSYTVREGLIGDLSFASRTSDQIIIFIEHNDHDLISLWENVFLRNSNPGDQPIYRVKFNRTISKKVEILTDSLTVEITIRDMYILGSIGSKLFPDICEDQVNVTCSDAYHCAASRVCIPLHQLCDGQKQCIYGDDEQMCGFYCPDKCSCTGYNINCTNTGFEYLDFETVSFKARSLDLSYNQDVANIPQNFSIDLPFLVVLNISMCDIQFISKNIFSKVNNLHVLDISFNKIEHILANTFSLLRVLKILILEGNYALRTIEPDAFRGLSYVKTLSITGSQLERIDASTFAGLELIHLNLSKNKITTVADYSFKDLTVETIELQQNNIETFSLDMFTGVESVIVIISSAYKICCVRPAYVKEENCYPHKNEFSSCSDLMRNPILQSMLWVIGISALLGNCASLIYRLKFDRIRLKLGYGIFVTNLAIADLLMGLYLLIIATADALFRDRYIWMDDYWRNSTWCTLAGVLSTMASEASVLFMCLITIDRLLVIKYPFGRIRFKTKSAGFVSCITWLVVLFIAILPIVYEDYFKSKFYTKSGVCLALPLTRDRPPGWFYAVIVFIGFNFMTFILISIGQLMIYREVRESSNRVSHVHGPRRNDLRVARNLLLIVATDFLCWIPIGCMGFMSIGGYVISSDVYAWVAVLILPINSAVNPFLYTLPAIMNRNRFSPSTDEQNRTHVQQDLRRQMIHLWRSPYFKRTSDDESYITLEEFVQRNVSITDLTKIAIQIAHCIKFLHNCELIHGCISMKNVIVVLDSTGQTLDHIRLQMLKPTVCTSEEEKAKDVYDLGCILRKLV